MNTRIGLAAAVAVAAIAFGGTFSGAVAQNKSKIVFAFEVPLSIVNVPNFIAIDRLKEMGYEIETVEFQSPETMSLALQNGEVDISNTSAGTVFSAIDAGFEGKIFLGQSNTDFQMVARQEFQTCESLDGKRVAVQSREGTTGVLAARWFEQECPQARPNILIVPGSENRVAGLIAGQLDAAPIDAQNTAILMQQRPGDFAVIDSFAESTKLLASVFYARTDWLAENKAAAMDFAKVYNDAVKEAYENSGPFLERLKETLPDADPNVLEEVLNGWVERKVWNPIGGVQPDTIQAAIAFYSSARAYERIKTPEDVSTTEYVEGLMQ